MNDFVNLFDKETVENISSLVENKMYLLNDLTEFREKDKLLAIATEEFENSLSKEEKKKFDIFMKLNYQIDSYYYTLAYFLGQKHFN